MNADTRLDIEHAYLRPIQLADVSAWYTYLSIPEVTEHTSWNLSSEKDLEQLVKTHLENGPESPIRFAILDKLSNQLIGTIGFHSLSSVSSTGELAYDIHPSFWGRGIATDVCKLVVNWGLSVHSFTRILAYVLETNAASVRVVEKSGFRFERMLENHRVVRGVPRDFYLYSVTSERK